MTEMTLSERIRTVSVEFVPDFEEFLQECCQKCGANRLWQLADGRGKPAHICDGNIWRHPEWRDASGNLMNEELPTENSMGLYLRDG